MGCETCQEELFAELQILVDFQRSKNQIVQRAAATTISSGNALNISYR
jgi:hypothetical protein